MNQIVTIRIKDGTLTKLAGYPYGYNLFESQVKGKIDLTRPFEIVFPAQIDYLASSFIQGFFGEINRVIGIDGIEKNMTITSNVPHSKEKVIRGLLMA